MQFKKSMNLIKRTVNSKGILCGIWLWKQLAKYLCIYMHVFYNDILMQIAICGHYLAVEVTNYIGQLHQCSIH